MLVRLPGGAVPFSFFTTAPEAQLTTSYWGSRNELAEVIALGRAGPAARHTERHLLGEINAVFAQLERGEIDGRAMLIP